MEPVVGQNGQDGTHAQKNPPQRVVLRREPFDTHVKLSLDDGSSEELEAEAARTWFRIRGANMDVIEEALTQVWNFYNAVVVIKSPKKVNAFQKLPDEVMDSGSLFQMGSNTN